MKYFPVQLVPIAHWVLLMPLCKKRASNLFVATHAFRRSLLNNSQHTQVPLPFLLASHGLSHSSGLSVLKLALLKSKLFVLLLVFSVSNRMLKSTMLWYLHPGLPFVVMLSSKSTQSMCSKSTMCCSYLTRPTFVRESSPQCISGTWWRTWALLYCFINKWPGSWSQ